MGPLQPHTQHEPPICPCTTPGDHPDLCEWHHHPSEAEAGARNRLVPPSFTDHILQSPDPVVFLWNGSWHQPWLTIPCHCTTTTPAPSSPSAPQPEMVLSHLTIAVARKATRFLSRLEPAWEVPSRPGSCCFFSIPLRSRPTGLRLA